MIPRSSKLFLILVSIRAWFRRLVAPFLWKSLQNRDEIKLELGAGAKKGTNGWTTVAFDQADINYDLRKGIPLKDNSVDIIYSSHMLEHIKYKHLITFLLECRRVLKDDGQFSVCVPNARLYIEAYMKGKMFRERETFYPPGMVDTGTLMDQLNYIAYLGDEHAYMFDEENFIATLKQGGFKDVALREFDPKLDIDWRDYESIYAIATK